MVSVRQIYIYRYMSEDGEIVTFTVTSITQKRLRSVFLKYRLWSVFPVDRCLLPVENLWITREMSASGGDGPSGRHFCCTDRQIPSSEAISMRKRILLRIDISVSQRIILRGSSSADRDEGTGGVDGAGRSRRAG